MLAKPVIFLIGGGPKNYAAIGLLQVLCIGAALRCATKIFAVYLTLIDRPGLASVAVFAGMAANFAIMVLMIPAFGPLDSAAWSTTANYVLTAIILTWGFVHFAHGSLGGIPPAPRRL